MAQHFYCFTEILLQVTRLFSVAENYKRLQGGGGGLDNCFGNLSRHDAKLFKMIRKIGRVASVTDCVEKIS